jgi:hypothetical protein
MDETTTPWPSPRRMRGILSSALSPRVIIAVVFGLALLGAVLARNDARHGPTGARTLAPAPATKCGLWNHPAYMRQEGAQPPAQSAGQSAGRLP